jgi:hypothetical protein
MYTTCRAHIPDRKKHQELVVTTKPYDSILWPCNHTGKSPHSLKTVKLPSCL